MSTRNREAAAFNALSRVLGDAEWFVPLSVRRAAARAALTAADQQVARDMTLTQASNIHDAMTTPEETQ